MLDFIVLGEIPGSTIQVTFSMVAAVAALFVLYLVIKRSIKRNRLDHRSIQTFYDLISL